MSTFTYQGRYPVLASRRGVWQEVAGWIDRRFGPFDSAVELGAGYCDFINSLPARHKRALDINPEMAHHAGPGVEFICGDVTTKWPIAPSSADLVFASNFLEHIPVFAGATLLREVKEALRPGGRLWCSCSRTSGAAPPTTSTTRPTWRSTRTTPSPRP
ncbi:MAG: class I SAM-dependent methyltransferase [Deltaproteobacteria bacterium]|nr:class I SAM-dependent methyltransferase [Deltaproteobacteria bacterium]